MNKTMHAGFLVLYFIALVLSGTFAAVCGRRRLVFFLVTSFQVLKMIVVLAVIIGGLCVLFPFLAPVALYWPSYFLCCAYGLSSEIYTPFWPGLTCTAFSPPLARPI